MKNKKWNILNKIVLLVYLILSATKKTIATTNNFKAVSGNGGCLILSVKEYLPNWNYYSITSPKLASQLYIENGNMLSYLDCLHTTDISDKSEVCFDTITHLSRKSYLERYACLKLSKRHHNINSYPLLNAEVSKEVYNLYIPWLENSVKLGNIFRGFSRTGIFCKDVPKNSLVLSSHNELLIDKYLLYQNSVKSPMNCLLSEGSKNSIPFVVTFTTYFQILKRKRRSSRISLERSFYEVKIKENTSKKTTILTLKPMGGSGSYTFTKISDQNTDDKFTIGEKSGDIKVMKILDREDGTPIFSMDFVVADNEDESATVTVPVSVILVDVNDNAPLFDQSSYAKSINEGKSNKYILTVRASDADDGINKDIIYSIVKNAGTYCPFMIDPKLGAITNTDLLDRERQPYFLFSVKAEDEGVDPHKLFSTVLVNISLNDINDNSPKFSQDVFYITLPEDTPKGATILKLNATDEDIGENGKIRYNTNNAASQFEINQLTGEITLKKMVDYDKFQRSFNFYVSAFDQGKPPNYSQVQVKVKVMDVNDNAPMFTRSEFKPSDPIREDIEIGKVVYKLSARDSDSGSNGEILYKFENRVSQDFPFTLNEESGVIKVVKKLDYEAKKEYQFNVVAFDKGTPKKTDTALVILPIRNINDNEPKFINSTYTIEISESKQKGDLVIEVKAVDPDQLSIHDFYYSIDSGNSDECFDIDPYQGHVLLKCDLDYKVKHRYELKLKVEDEDKKAGFANLYVNVYDANNNAPIFTKRVNRLTVKEDVDINSAIGRVTATDDDSGENARISYSIQDSDTFKINASSGELSTMKMLDREKENAFITLEIIATDNGKPSKKSGSTTVLIAVEDVNDNMPQFVEKSYKFNIKENVEIGSVVGSVSATDADEGLNKEIRYFFQDQSEMPMFSINAERGTIRTTQLLDREKQASYSFGLIAIDQGTPQLQSSATVMVTLDDVQDSDPHFLQAVYNFTIDENANVEVGRVRATLADTDFQKKLRYSIIEQLPHSMFRIDRNLGIILPNRKLDYEQGQSYTLKVRVQTLMNRQDTAVVNVKVNDVNDNPPVLQNFYIFLNILNNDFNPIFRIPATDRDVTSVLKYQIISGNDHDFVNLDNMTGLLLMKRSIVNTPSEIQILFEVSDGIESTQATGHISISEVSNDMINNSISIVLKNATKNEFLSTQMLLKFKGSLATAFKCNSGRIFIIGIENFVNTLPRRKQAGEEAMPMLEVTVSVREENSYSFMTSHTLKNKLYFNTKQFEQDLGFSILTFDFSIEAMCAVESCRNYQTCGFTTNAQQNHTTTRSKYVTFRGVSFQTRPNCYCVVDKYYNGPVSSEVCGHSYNLCYKKPCGKFGKCVSTDTDFACVCHANYYGKYCHIHKDESICPSSPSPRALFENPCGQNGACVTKQNIRLPFGDSNKGFKCSCHPSADTDTDMCTLSTRYFPKRSFVAFDGLRQRWNLYLTMEVRTTEANAVLLYNGRFTNENDFIVVEIVDGQLMCSVSFGHLPKDPEIVTSVSGFVPGGVNDGLWHTVKVQLKDKVLSIAAGALCDIDTAEQLNSEGTKRYCAAAKKVQGPMKSLDLTGPLIIGGLANSARLFRSKTSNLNGCIRNVSIDYQTLDLSSFLYNSGSHARCPVPEDGKCQANPCNNGLCTNVTASGAECECADDYAGIYCGKRTSVVTLSKDSKLFVDSQVSRGVGGDAWSHALSIKTTATNGTLVVEKMNDRRFFLKISNGYVTYSSETSTLLNLTSVYVSNSKWHHIQLSWRASVLTLSAGYHDNAHTVTKRYYYDPKSVKIVLLSLGRDQDDDDGARGEPFIGCLKNFVYSGKQVLLTSNKNVQTGCKQDENLLCAAKDCGQYGKCEVKFGVATCVCDEAGYKGPNCVNICADNPCNQGNCIVTTSKLSGFFCQCSVNFTGEFCETRIKSKCDPGYYNNGPCDPCQCSTEKNFNATCDPDGSMPPLYMAGECFCKDGYYKTGPNQCSACNCVAVGSKSHVCNKTTGQCQCKAKVLGKRCERCPGAWQELGAHCIEINNSCPKTYSEGITWDRVALGNTGKANCPFNAVGTVTRYCHPRNSWDPPKFFGCTSLFFSLVQSTLNQILSGAKKMDTSTMIRLSYQLELAVNSPNMSLASHPFYGKDIEIGYEALKLMIAYEGNQSERFLVSSEDSSFLRKILTSTSKLFSPSVASFWDTIQETHPGTAGLMREMETFVSKITDNLAFIKRGRSRRSLSVLTGYSEATDNIYIEIRPLNKEENKTYTLPIMQSDWSKKLRMWRTPSMEVVIDRKWFYDNPHMSGKNEINVGIIIYKTLGKLLPREENRKSGELIVHSDVITLTIPGVKKISSDEDIKIVFQNVKRLNTTDEPLLCMFWNYSLSSTLGGGWSKKGCRTVLDRQMLEVTCFCDHLTSFALVGVKHTVVTPRVYTVHFLTYIGLGISMCLLFFVFLVFVCLRQLKSNANSIHKNLALVACLGWLVFCLTINKIDVGERNCRVFAILIHYFLTCTFSWLMVEALHMYRMILEPRDINYGQMMFYYFIGWGAPVVVVGVTTGLKPSGYETSEFCWVSLRRTLDIWTYTAPILAIIAGQFIMLMLALVSSCEAKNSSDKKKSKLSRIRYRLIISFNFLMVIMLSVVSALIVVSYDDTIFNIVFPAACVLEGVYMLLFYIIFNRKVRREAKNAYIRFSTGDKSYGLKPPRNARKRLADKERLINERYAHVFEAFNIDSTSSNESSDTVDGRRKARKRVMGSDSTEFPTTAGDSSDSSDDDTSVPGGRHNSDKQIHESDDSESSDNSSGVDDYTSTPNGNVKLPQGVEWKQATQKKLALSRTYASDGPMHSTPSESEASDSKKKWTKVGFTPTKINKSELSAIASEGENATPSSSSGKPKRSSKGKRAKKAETPLVIQNSSNTDSDTASQAKAPVSILKKKSQYDSNGHRLRAVRVKDTGSRKPLMSLNDTPDFNDSEV